MPFSQKGAIMRLPQALQNFIKDYPLSSSQIDKLRRLMIKGDADFYQKTGKTIDWKTDDYTLYGNMATNRFILITNDEYLRLDVRYDFKTKENDYVTRIVYNLDEDFHAEWKTILNDLQFISSDRSPEEIQDWADYVLNYETGEENPLVIE